jgi:hypothetical protein
VSRASKRGASTQFTRERGERERRAEKILIEKWVKNLEPILHEPHHGLLIARGNVRNWRLGGRRTGLG